MRAYIGFDDTDHHDAPYGTGKLVRWFEERLPAGCHCQGVVRQQLLVCDAIAYTSHNSAACMIVELDGLSQLDDVISTAAAHIGRWAVEGSDPGLCVAVEGGAGLEALKDFGRLCTHTVVNRQQARQAAAGAHLSGHGGTNDGIIGAAAAVGLTAGGWCGRFIELGDLRGWPAQTTVGQLGRHGVAVLSIDREARVPAPDDIVLTRGWLRPRLVSHRAVLLVRPTDPGTWENIDRKRQKEVAAGQSGTACRGAD